MHSLVPHSARCPCAPLAHDLSLFCLLLRLLATVLPRPCRRPPGTARLRLDAPAPNPLTRVMSHPPVRSVTLLQHWGTPLQIQYSSYRYRVLYNYRYSARLAGYARPAWLGKGPFPYKTAQALGHSPAQGTRSQGRPAVARAGSLAHVVAELTPQSSSGVVALTITALDGTGRGA